MRLWAAISRRRRRRRWVGPEGVGMGWIRWEV
jgi:hypothetical protein